MDEPAPDSDHTRRLLDQARRGDPAAVGDLLARHRPAMRALVGVHMDPRLAARVDPSDVVQDAQAEVARRLPDFLARAPMPFHLWARKTAYERLQKARRDHLGRARRAAGREVSLPERSSLLLARPLLGRGPSPSQQAVARELAERVGRAVASLPEADREVLLLRHADGLPFAEVAALLGVDPAVARKRFGRAIIRLRTALAVEGLLGDKS